MNKQERLGKAPVGKLLLEFSIPTIISMMVNALYTIVDRIYIGHISGIGYLALVGVGVTQPLTLIIFAFSMLIGTGASIYISINLGKGNKEEAEKTLGNTLIFTIIVGAIISIIGLLLLKYSLYAFGATNTTFIYGQEFMRILYIGTIFNMFSFVLTQIIRADGSPKKAMHILLIGITINIVLDPILIFLVGLGVTGAALATMISQIIITILAFRYFKSKHSVLKITKSALKFNYKRSLRTSKFGIAAFVTQLTSSLVLVVANNSLKLHGGALSIGAMTIIAAVAQVFYTPVYGINQGAQPIIGFNFGAKKIKRTIDTVSKASLAATILMIIAFLVIEIFPKEVIEIFNGNSSLINDTIFGMRIYLLCLPLDGFQIIASNYFRSIGHVKVATFLGQLRKGLLFIPLVFILPIFWGITGVWLSGCIGDFLSFLITAIIFFREIHKLKKSKEYKAELEESKLIV